MALEQQDAAANQRTREAAAPSLEQSTQALLKVGGFDLLETTIDGASNLNPDKKARKKIFLSEDSKKNDRKQLKKRLALWHSLLSDTTSVAEIVEKGEERVEAAKELLTSNLKNAVEATHELEQAYRSLALFFRNTDQDEVKNVSIMNADKDQLQDLDNTTFIDAVSSELEQNYDRLDLRDNYSLLVVPGYLGSNKVVDKWAKIAHKNKVMMVTDFEHYDTPEDVIELFEEANLTGGDAYKSNVVMAANWLVGRGKIEEIGEEEDLFVPPSSALAGRIYTTLASQVTAGRKHGTLNEVDGVKFPLRKSEISNLEKIGLVPMVNEYGRVMAFSAKTLFSGDNIGLQTYSVVRVFDYVTKVLIDFLNRRAFENWDHNMRMDIQNQIVRFLDGIAGPGKLIEKFSIKKFERDPDQKDRILLDIHMVPYFPAKTFLVSLDGTKGDDPDNPGRDWNAEYAQQ
ncbi:MAG: type VI secretion system contractile sheath protein TssC [Cytophagaceae bacterium]|nr:MAG: type VI secretion system contractile sheath protein TssC [Cytophagaceae bacterium]